MVKSHIMLFKPIKIFFMGFLEHYKKGVAMKKKIKLKITIDDDGIIIIKAGRKSELFQGYTMEEAVCAFMEHFKV